MARRLAKSLNLKGKVLWAGISVAGTCALISWGLVNAPRVWAQKTGAPPSFEVASIKVDKSAMPLGGIHLFGDRFSATGGVMGFIEHAYGRNGRPLSDAQVSGVPDWAKSEVFDIDAKIDDSLTDGPWKKLSFDQQWDQVMLMLQSLLTDRFKLAVTHQTKQLPVYALVLAKNGPKFAEDDSHPEGGIGARPADGGRLQQIEGTSSPMNILANVLSFQPELGSRPVLDQTGLKGRYSFILQWAPERLAATASQKEDSAAGTSGPSLFTALEQELGLKLQSTKAPVDTIVIEHIERPTEN